jgi:hypothetical protein
MTGTAWQLRTDSVSGFAQSLNDGYRVFNRFVLKDSPIKFYELGTGFWQYWDMFAPNPADADYFGDAVVTFKDGSSLTYEYPRMFKMNILAKYTKERYRKFYERANTEDYQYLWPHFAQYVALLNYKDPHNPPVRVVLWRHWKVIQPQDKPQEKDYHAYPYYTHVVDQDELNYASKSVFVGPYKPHQSSLLSSSGGGNP